ncbi:MAG: hypothetical protein RL041_1526, partial [Bacteroidota bacterium]
FEYWRHEQRRILGTSYVGQQASNSQDYSSEIDINSSVFIWLTQKGAQWAPFVFLYESKKKQEVLTILIIPIIELYQYRNQ